MLKSVAIGFMIAALSIGVGISVGRTARLIPPAKPGDRPLEITVPYNPDACTKADLAKIEARITELENR